MIKFRRELGVFVSVVLTAFCFQLFSAGAFLKLETWGNILSLAAEVGIISLGLSFLMIAGEIDLSVGATFAVSGMIFSLAAEQWHLPGLLAIVLALFFSAVVGLVNGLITTLGKIPSFIATLGTMMMVRGTVLAITGGWPISRTEDPSFLMEVLAGSFGEFWRFSSLWWLGLSVLLHAVLFSTAWGNWIFAVGGNRDSAWALGIPVKRVKIAAFVLSSLLAGFSGVVQFSRMGSFSPTSGEGLELEVITSAVIGGTALTGGKGGILGTFLGTLLMSMIASGLVLTGAPVYWYRVFVGGILIIAVLLNRKFEL